MIQKLLFKILCVMVLYNANLSAHPFQKPSAMADVGDEVDHFMAEPFGTFDKQFGGNRGHNIFDRINKTLSGQKYGVRKSGPREDELRYLLSLMHILSLTINPNDMKRLENKAQSGHTQAIHAYIRGLQSMNQDFRPQNQGEISTHLHQLGFNKQTSDHVAKNLWNYIPIQAYINIRKSLHKLKELQFVLNDQNLDDDTKFLLNIVDNLHEIYLLKGQNKAKVRFNSAKIYIRFVVALVNHKNEIIQKARDLWDQFLSGTYRQNNPHAELYHEKQTHQFQQAFDDALDLITNIEGPPPCFENLSSVGIDENLQWLPRDPQSKENAMAIIESNLSLGATLVQKASQLLQTRPDLIKSFGDDFISNLGFCIPMKNTQLEDWLRAQSVLSNIMDDVYHYARDQSNSLDDKVGHIAGLYQTFLLKKAQHYAYQYNEILTKEDLSLTGPKRAKSLQFQFDPHWTLNKATDWIYEKTKEAYTHHNAVDEFQVSGFANKNDIRHALDALYMFDS